jgi:hypothetical protein
MQGPVSDFSQYGTIIALLTGMLDSSPRQEHSIPPSASSGAKWFELAMNYLPSILKMLAALGLFKTMRKRRQNLQTRRAGKTVAEIASAKEWNRWA